MTDDDYDVGYGKPPKYGQFQKGQSGNSAGRKKGSKNLSTRIREAMEQKVTVTIDGQRRRMAKLDVGLHHQSNKLASGDPKSLKLMWELKRNAEADDAAKADKTERPTEEKHARNARIMAAIKARFEGEGGDGC